MFEPVRAPRRGHSGLPCLARSRCRGCGPSGSRRGRTSIGIGLLIFAFPARAAVPVQLDWDAETWPAGDLTRTFPDIGNGDVSITFSGETTSLVDFGGSPSPNRQNSYTGGLVPVEFSLGISVDHPSGSSDEITFTIDFSHPNGVTDVSFTIFDVDAAFGHTDQLQVTATDGSGSFNPSSVTTSVCNAFDGTNVVDGICNVGSTSGNGNATFTFNQPAITRITIVYRNTVGLSNPGVQNIALHDVDFSWEPLTIVKRALWSDGTPIASGSTLPKGVPVKFLLYVNNRGKPVSDVSLRDVLDPLFSFVSGSIKYDNSTAACATVTCDAAEEAAIFAATETGTAGTDDTDGDVVSVSGTILNVGNQNAANAQLDIAAGKVWSVLFTIRLQ